MESPKQVFIKYLKDNGIRHSYQRECILNVFLNTERHLSAIELYQLVKKEYAGIGYATVYRALKTICDAGLAREVDFSDGILRFEHKYGHTHHDHMICIACGKCIEVVDTQIERLQAKLAAKYKFTPTKHKMEIFGICSQCSKKREKKKA